MTLFILIEKSFILCEYGENAKKNKTYHWDDVLVTCILSLLKQSNKQQEKRKH